LTAFNAPLLFGLVNWMIVIVVENTQITEGKTGQVERLRRLKILILTSLIKLF
jgi:hypothetical protein